FFKKRKMNMAKKTKKVINVQPLRTKEEIEEMKLAIKRGNKGTSKRMELAERDILIFLLGINTGLRVNDLVKLKVEDVRGKQAFGRKEGKARNEREVKTAVLAGEMERYADERDSEEDLFPSQKGDNHVSTTQVCRILESAGDVLGREDIGTHTMRKTFGYHH